MKHNAVVILAFLLATLAVFGTRSARAQTWELVWSDEFDYTGLPDPARWGYDIGGHGWGNQESQYYTSNREKNARVDGTNLIIEAHLESYGGSNYTSARLVTKNKGDWAYGRIQVRAQLPSGRGTWPAIWLLPTQNPYGNGSWPDNGEIDIMEHVGYDPGRIYHTIHTDKYNHLQNNSQGGNTFIADAETAFHDYQLDWTPTRLEFSVDSTVNFVYHNEQEGWTSWPFDHPFHLLLNIAIGGSWGGQQGIDDSIFPQQMLVDYVRVFRYLEPPQVSLTLPQTLAPGETLDLSVTATDSDGTVERVEIRHDEVALARFTAPPYELSIEDVQEGCYPLSAYAVDDRGWTSHSDTTVFKVGNQCEQASYLVGPHAIPGTIEAEHYDIGGQDVAYYDHTTNNLGDGIRQSEGVDIYHTDDGDGYHVRADDGEWLEYTARVTQSGYYSFFVRMEPWGTRAAVKLLVDGQEVAALDEIRTPLTWGYVFQQDIPLTEGVKKMRLEVDVDFFNINWIRFAYAGPLSADQEGLDGQAVLHENYPNPFRDATRLTYSVSRPGPAKVEVFNTLGRRIALLVDRHHGPGLHQLHFDAQGLESGLFLYRLTTPTAQIQRAMLHIR